MPLVSNNTDGRRRRYKVEVRGTQIILEQVMLVACQDIITLNARLLETSDRPHTYFWEQISGAPVTWLEAQNQLMVMWQQPADRGDKIFRFWLDRNTSFELFQDILVTTVNREPMVSPQTREVLDCFPYLSSQVVSQATVQNMPSPRIDNPDGVLVDSTDRALRWISPSSLTGVQKIQLVSVDKNGIVAELQDAYPTAPSISQWFGGLNVNEIYRIDTILNTSGTVKRIEGVPTRVLPYSTRHELEAFESAILHPAIGNPSFSRTVIERTLKEQSTEDTWNGTSNIGVSFYSKTVLIPSLVQFEPIPEDQMASSSVGVLSMTKTVTPSPGVISIG